jgi:superfamily II DNA or RNA helicase
VTFQGGTLVLYGVARDADVPPAFQWIKERWRCEAFHYPALAAWFKANSIRDQVPRWERLTLTMRDQRESHAYQIAALKAWEAANRLGSIVLPTGAGKTFLAIQAVYRLKRSAVVVAPTIDLLHQWYARLANAFNVPIGVYYGGEKQIEPITVTTYHSAGDLIAGYGSLFKLIIYDEVHHLPAPSWGETALMSPSPYRLGLTATYPEAHEQEGGRWRVEDLIGPIVFEQHIDDLVGNQLADYRTERVRVELSPDERRQYDIDHALYVGFVQSQDLPRIYGSHWLMELMRRGSFDPEARRVLLARTRLQRLLAGAEAKLVALDNLLREYLHERVLVFTEQNDLVYAISRRHLIPALTHETKAAERKQILEGFQSGAYQAIVTSKVLNEGVDVPEAKVAIVLGGTSSAREYVQRLGRVLRKAGSRQAVLFEVIVRDSLEERQAQRRVNRKREANAHG